MEIKIKGKKENVLLNRIEIEADINHFKEPTPTRKQVKEKLAAMLSVDKELVVIHKLEQTFGSLTKCSAVVYKNKSDLEKTEQEHLLKRDAKKYKAEEKKEEAKTEQAPKEEGKEEKPAEEPKPEEKKVEEAK